MRFTPFHSWPVAEDIDVVKQYPATVDQPFKDALDPVTATVAANVDLFGGQIDFPQVQVRFGTYTDATDAAGLGTIVFKPAFSNNALYVIATMGGGGPFLVTPTAYTPTMFQALFYTTTGSIWASQSFTLNYIAIGW